MIGRMSNRIVASLLCAAVALSVESSQPKVVLAGPSGVGKTTVCEKVTQSSCGEVGENGKSQTTNMTSFSHFDDSIGWDDQRSGSGDILLE